MSCKYKSILFILILSLPCLSLAQTKVGTSGRNYLLYSNSPRVNALGGCSINLVDEQSSFFNPGTLGILHLDKLMAISLPNLFKSIRENIGRQETRSCFTASGGIDYRLIFGNNDAGWNISLAFAYSRDNFEANEPSDYIANEVNKSQILTNYYTISAGFEYHVRIGIGYSLHSPNYVINNVDYSRDYNGDDKNDLGIYMDLPIKLLHRIGDSTDNLKYNKLMLRPSFAYVRKGMNKNNYFGSNPSDYLGFGIHGGINNKDINLFSLQLLLEYDRPGSRRVYSYDYNNYNQRYDYVITYEWRRKFGLNSVYMI